MFCPSCRAEYREGYFRCADCDVDLVEKLPELKDKQGFVALASVFTEGEIALIKSRLDQAGISYYLQGELSHRLAPLPFGVRLMVREDCLEEAKALLMESDQS